MESLAYKPEGENESIETFMVKMQDGLFVSNYKETRRRLCGDRKPLAIQYCTLDIEK